MKGAWLTHFQDGRGFGWTRSPTNTSARKYWSGMAGAASAAGARANSTFTTLTRGVSSEMTPSTISSLFVQAAINLCIQETKREARLRLIEVLTPDWTPAPQGRIGQRGLAQP